MLDYPCVSGNRSVQHPLTIPTSMFETTRRAKVISYGTKGSLENVGVIGMSPNILLEALTIATSWTTLN
jgi:hypothetical protein